MYDFPKNMRVEPGIPVCIYMMFALLMLFCVCYLAYYVVGKSMNLLCILPFGMLCLSAISMMFVKIMLAVYILVGLLVSSRPSYS